jgi:lipopolysaccharide transport system ATP-binding protein
MAAVRSLCKSGIVLSNGMVEYTGTAVDSINYYLNKTTKFDIGALWKREVINENSLFQLLKAGVYDEKGELKTSYECDEPIIIDLHVSVKEQVPNIYGWFGIMNAKTAEYIWVSDSNDIVMNKLQTLPVGEHTIRLTIPKRSIAPGDYLVTVNFQSDQNISGFTMDRNEEILKFEVHDYQTERGDKRTGYFSTLLDWQFLNK